MFSKASARIALTGLLTGSAIMVGGGAAIAAPAELPEILEPDVWQNQWAICADCPTPESLIRQLLLSPMGTGSAGLAPIGTPATGSVIPSADEWDAMTNLEVTWEVLSQLALGAQRFLNGDGGGQGYVE